MTKRPLLSLHIEHLNSTENTGSHKNGQIYFSSKSFNINYKAYQLRFAGAKAYIGSALSEGVTVFHCL